MLKRATMLGFALSLFVLLTAMGGKGGGFERVPRVDRNFAVTVTDVTGHKIDGEKFSWEGRIRFSGSMGMADVNLPFEKIKELTIGEKRDRRVLATARLTDGGEASLEIDADSRCYGETNFGSFMLLISEIKTISFKGIR